MNTDLDRLDELLIGGARYSDYKAYREYYNGDHSTQLTKRLRRFLQLKTGEEFNANFCPIVVDAVAERLTITGFKAEGQGELFAEWWQDARMDGVQSSVHTSAVRDGDAYVLVGWDEELGRPTFDLEMSYNGSEGMHVFYGDKRRQPAFAVKIWQVGKDRLANLYYPDRVEHYRRGGVGGWEYYATDTHEPVERWLATDGSPLGIPVVHFRNQDQGYNYGLSELKSVVPLQNALNKSLIDLLGSADVAGFPIFYMIGDDPGGLSLLPGSWVYSKRPKGDVDIGKISGEASDNLIAVFDALAMNVARVTRTPLHYFQIGGQRAAEGTLKQEEVGLISKIESRQVYFGNAWEDCMILARRLANTFGQSGLSEDQSVTSIWDSAIKRDEDAEVKRGVIKARDLGIPRTTVWAELGYSEEEIAEMMASPEYQARLAQAEAASIGLAALRANATGAQGGRQSGGEDEPAA